jgi:hypothetical protein
MNGTATPCTLLHTGEQATASLLPFRWEQPQGLAARGANNAKVAEIYGQNAIGSDPFSDCHHGGVG